MSRSSRMALENGRHRTYVRRREELLGQAAEHIQRRRVTINDLQHEFISSEAPAGRGGGGE